MEEEDGGGGGGGGGLLTLHGLLYSHCTCDETGKHIRPLMNNLI